MPKALRAILKPAAMLAAMAGGALLPGMHNSVIIRYCLMSMLFIMFLHTDFDDIKLQRSHLRLLLLNLAMGILPFFLFSALKRPELAQAAFWTGIAPTATAAPVVMGFLGGQANYVLAGFVLSNCCIPLALPLLLVGLSGHFSYTSMLPIAWNIVQLIGVPLYLARLLRMVQARVSKHAKRLKNLSFALWVIMLFYIAADASAFIQQQDSDGGYATIWLIAALSLLICLLNFLLGYSVGSSGLRRESSQTLGQKNTSLTIYLALSYANPLAALGPTFYVFWHNTWNALQLYYHARYKSRATAEDENIDPQNKEA
jgi:BASS family bile acid:Na+ symporter